MHECWNCGQACDCDGEDTWNSCPDECECECEEMNDALEDEYRDYPDEDYYDPKAMF